MKYFLIAFIMSCVISCGFKNPDTAHFVSTIEDEEYLEAGVNPSIERKNLSNTEEPVVTSSEDTALAFKQINTSGSVKSNPVFTASPDSAQPEAIVSVTENEAMDLELASSVIPPDSSMIQDLFHFVKNELRKEGTESSYVFDRYIEKLIMASVSEEYRDDKNKIDEIKWMKESGFFDVRSATIPHQRVMEKDRVFNRLAYLNYTNPMGIREGNKQNAFIERIPIKGREKEETVLFVNSLIFDSSSDQEQWDDWTTERLDQIKPDRIAVMRSPGLLDFIRGKKAFKQRDALAAQAERLARLTSYIRKHRIPVHVMGMCDYFCSSYLIPQTKKVYIEPFGEVAFNGSFKVVSDTFENLLQLAKKSHNDTIEDEIANLDLFPLDYLQRQFHLPREGTFYQYLSNLENYTLLSKVKKSAGPNRSFEELSDAELRIVLGNLSKYEKSQVLGFFQSEKIQVAKKRVEVIQDIMKKFSLFNKHFPDTAAQSPLFGGGNRNLERFFYYTGLATSSFFAGEFQDSSTSRYFVPTEPKEGEENPMIAYSHVSPRTTILNKLGINVRGKNSGYRKHILAYQREKMPIAPISEAVLASCNFFQLSFSSPQEVTGCLSRIVEELKAKDTPHGFFSI